MDFFTQGFLETVNRGNDSTRSVAAEMFDHGLGIGGSRFANPVNDFRRHVGPDGVTMVENMRLTDENIEKFFTAADRFGEEDPILDGFNKALGFNQKETIKRLVLEYVHDTHQNMPGFLNRVMDRAEEIQRFNKSVDPINALGLSIASDIYANVYIKAVSPAGAATGQPQMNAKKVAQFGQVPGTFQAPDSPSVGGGWDRGIAQMLDRLGQGAGNWLGQNVGNFFMGVTHGITGARQPDAASDHPAYLIGHVLGQGGASAAQGFEHGFFNRPPDASQGAVHYGAHRLGGFIGQIFNAAAFKPQEASQGDPGAATPPEADNKVVEPLSGSPSGSETTTEAPGATAQTLAQNSGGQNENMDKKPDDEPIRKGFQVIAPQYDTVFEQFLVQRLFGDSNSMLTNKYTSDERAK